MMDEARRLNNAEGLPASLQKAAKKLPSTALDLSTIPVMPVKKKGVIGGVDLSGSVEERENTVARILEAVPDTKKMYVTEEFINKVLNGSEDEQIAKAIVANFETYTSVLKKGNNTLEEYRLANKYVTLMMCGYDEHERYELTFPERHLDMLQKGFDKSQRCSRIWAYERGALVSNLIDQVNLPVALMHRSTFHKNIATLDAIANPPDSVTYKDIHPRERVAAASKLLDVLAPKEDPLSKAFESATDTGKSIIDILKENLALRVGQMHAEMENGTKTAAQTAAEPIIPKDVKNATDADSEDLVYDSRTNSYVSVEEAKRLGDQLQVGN